MHLTVEQALSVYPLSEGKLIAGTAGKNRVVKSINVMDAPDISDWIKEGEMLFTTAYLIKDSPNDAAELLGKLNRRGCSGLGIKLGRFWEAIPENLIEQANHLSFPLIELPFQFTFSDQMKGLFQDEMKRSTMLLEETLEKQIRLMRCALQFEPSRSLFDSVAEVIGCAMAIVGSRGQMLYNSSDIDDESLLYQWPWPLHKRWIKHQSLHSFRIPLMNQDLCTGFVYFFNPHLFLSTVEEGLYIQTAELISHHMNFKYEDYFEHSVQKDFGMVIKHFLKHALPVETVIDYIERWEMDWLQQGYRCVLVDFPLEFDSRLRMERLNGLKSQFLYNARMQALKGIHVVLEDGLLTVIPDVEKGTDAVGLQEALDSCFAGMGMGGRNMPKAAICTRKKRIHRLADAFQECQDTLRLAKDWEIGDQVVSYEMLDLALVFERVSRDRMRKYCDHWLGGLLHKEPSYVNEMLKTLETYLECDGQLNETAKKLFIHRNTATYRIEKLSELLDVDFKKINDLIRLKIAFLFRRMLLREMNAAENGLYGTNNKERIP